MKKGFLKAILSFITLFVVILAVSAYFIFNSILLGFLFLLIGFLILISLKFFKIELDAVYPDMIFGFIDNSILVFGAVIGGNFAGVIGAVIGGAAGNTITDGIGGLFEGYVAEHQRKFKIDNLRTPISSMMGKMAGCLFGAGISLIFIKTIGL